MFIRRLCLLVALCLLPRLADAQTMTVTSNYGVLAFGTVTVTDVTPTPHVVLATCSFSSSATCNVSGLIAGHTLSVTPTPAAGFVVTGGVGKCAGLSPTNIIQFTVPTSGSVQCGVAGGYPLMVTANNAGVVAALIASSGAQCSLPGTAGQSCQLAVAPGPLSLTIGLAANTALVSGTGLCTNAAPTTNPFQITVPASPSALACGINTKSTPPPLPLPQSGWWWMPSDPDTHLRFGLQINGAVTPKALLGTVYTFRTDGSAVWYLINAVLNNEGTAYVGTASEFSGGGGLTGQNTGPSGLKTIVANVTFTFASPTLATLVWSPRAGGPPLTLTLSRYSFSTTGLPLTAFAPVPGAYNPPRNPNSIGYFIEMQGTATSPYAYFAASYFDSKGRATWADSNTLIYRTTKPITRYPAGTGAQTGWTVTATLDSYSGGAPIGMAAKTPKVVPGPTAVAVLGTSITNKIAIGSGHPTPLTMTAGWGLATSPYWLQIVDNSKTINNVFVTWFPGGTGSFSYLNTQGRSLSFPRYTSVALSSIANGALLASSPSLGGNLYVSNAALKVRSTVKPNPCVAINPQNQAAPSPLTSANDCNVGTRWQFIELGGDYDVTYINLYSIPLSINQGSTSSAGNLTPQQLTSLQAYLGDLSGGAQVYPAKSQRTTSFVRDIAPANGGDAIGSFPSFSTYIAAAFNSSGLATENINNQYSGNTPQAGKTICSGAAFAQQSYSTSSVKYLGNTLTITGNGTVAGNFTLTGMVPAANPPVGCGNPIGPTQCYTQTVAPTDLSNAFYTAVIYYSITGTGPGAQACNKTGNTVESNGANDVFAVAVRDFLVGFASGFVNSTVAAPPPPLSPPNPPASTYGTMTSEQWSNSAAKLFTQVQPSSTLAKPSYNPWGALVFDYFGSSVYGFQYSDYFSGPLGNPLLVVQPSIPLQLVIMNDQLPQKH